MDAYSDYGISGAMVTKSLITILIVLVFGFSLIAESFSSDLDHTPLILKVILDRAANYPQQINLFLHLTIGSPRVQVRTAAQTLVI